MNTTKKTTNTSSGPAHRVAPEDPAVQVRRVVELKSERADPMPEPAPVTETVISCREFSSWYGKFQALHSLSLEIPKRRVTALIGPSGCGKSTFLRWINRMNDTITSARSSGLMTLGGLDITSSHCDVVDLRRRVGPPRWPLGRGVEVSAAPSVRSWHSVRAVRIRERRACGRADDLAASASRLMRMRSVRASRHSPE